jgi:hypothetical protein
LPGVVVSTLKYPGQYRPASVVLFNRNLQKIKDHKICDALNI